MLIKNKSDVKALLSQCKAPSQAFILRDAYGTSNYLVALLTARQTGYKVIGDFKTEPGIPE